MSENDLVHENVVKHLIIKKNSQDLKRDPSSKKIILKYKKQMHLSLQSL